jgi:hypothetical protein
MPASKKERHVDTSVHVPAAVRAAAAKADEAHAALYPVDPAPEPAPQPEPTPEPAPQPAPAPEPAPQPIAEVTPEVTESGWEHRYNSMKGRHDRLAAANQQLNERVAGLEATLASMAAQAPLPTSAPAAPQSLITPEDLEQWGPEMMSVIERKAEEKMRPIVSDLKNQITELTDRLQGVGHYVAQDARSRMKADLTKALPNWEQVNENQRFINWLGLPDAYSGAIRDQLLQAAYAANDTPRVLAFFNGFLAEEAANAPRHEPAPAPTPAVEKVPLESLAAPGRATIAAVHSAPAEKPTFTRAEVTQFYVDVTRGAYRGRDEDKLRLEKQISDAGREGRIK